MTMLSNDAREELYGLLEAFAVAVDERSEYISLVFNDPIVLGPSTNDLDMAAWNVFSFIEDALTEREFAWAKEADKQFDEGRVEGIEDGYDTGYAEGYSSGWDAAYNEGYDNGYTVGLEGGSHD